MQLPDRLARGHLLAEFLQSRHVSLTPSGTLVNGRPAGREVAATGCVQVVTVLARAYEGQDCSPESHWFSHFPLFRRPCCYSCARRSCTAVAYDFHYHTCLAIDIRSDSGCAQDADVTFDDCDSEGGCSPPAAHALVADNKADSDAEATASSTSLLQVAARLRTVSHEVVTVDSDSTDTEVAESANGQEVGVLPLQSDVGTSVGCAASFKESRGSCKAPACLRAVATPCRCRRLDSRTVDVCANEGFDDSRALQPTTLRRPAHPRLISLCLLLPRRLSSAFLSKPVQASVQRSTALFLSSPLCPLAAIACALRVFLLLLPTPSSL